MSLLLSLQQAITLAATVVDPIFLLVNNTDKSVVLKRLDCDTSASDHYFTLERNVVLGSARQFELDLDLHPLNTSDDIFVESGLVLEQWDDTAGGAGISGIVTAGEVVQAALGAVGNGRARLTDAYTVRPGDNVAIRSTSTAGAECGIGMIIEING